MSLKAAEGATRVARKYYACRKQFTVTVGTAFEF
jgi:hypothetical protein